MGGVGALLSGGGGGGVCVWGVLTHFQTSCIRGKCNDVSLRPGCLVTRVTLTLHKPPVTLTV